MRHILPFTYVDNRIHLWYFVNRLFGGDKKDAKKFIISPKKYKGETSVVSARLPVEMIKALDEIAENTGRNRNEIITLCLEFAVDNLSIESQ